MSNKIDDLIDHLFETLKMVKSGEMDIDRARAMSEVSARIIDTAKVENEFLRITDSVEGTGFIEIQEPDSALPHPALRIGKR